nr:DNA polymerase IV [Compostimonas suwonensis]
MDDSSATILHVDMDAFFASVELLGRPELRSAPVVIAHTGARSVVTSANYVARRFGVRSAMPLAVALRHCPGAVVLPPHMEEYRRYSAEVMGIFSEVTPLVEQLSIDEAFLDVAGARRLLGSPGTIAKLVRERVYERTGLTCSVGAASTKFVAKLASTHSKPDGLLIVPAEGTIGFLHPLPVGALWGVGAATEQSLTRLGIRTVADLAHTPLATLERAVGVASGRHLHELAWGRDPRSVSTESIEKSIGHETTFEIDLDDDAAIRRELLRLSDQVGARLRRSGAVARTVVLKLRYSDFTTVTRSRSLPEATSVGRRIYDEIVIAFDSLGVAGRAGRAVRLVGVRTEHLESEGSVLASLWDPDSEWREAEAAVDEVVARFGRGSVRPASLVKRDQAPPEA